MLNHHHSSCFPLDYLHSMVLWHVPHLDSLSSFIRCTWQYHISCLCYISCITEHSNLIISLTVLFLAQFSIFLVLPYQRLFTQLFFIYSFAFITEVCFHEDFQDLIFYFLISLVQKISFQPLKALLVLIIREPISCRSILLLLNVIPWYL